MSIAARYRPHETPKCENAESPPDRRAFHKIVEDDLIGVRQV